MEAEELYAVGALEAVKTKTAIICVFGQLKSSFQSCWADVARMPFLVFIAPISNAIFHWFMSTP